MHAYVIHTKPKDMKNCKKKNKKNKTYKGSKIWLTVFNNVRKI